MDDTKEPNWNVVVKTRLRNLYDLPSEDIGDKSYQENEEIGFIHLESNIDDSDDIVSLNRPTLILKELY